LARITAPAESPVPTPAPIAVMPIDAIASWCVVTIDASPASMHA
jgi:hypothetical protein